jgi:hypothetical protein
MFEWIMRLWTWLFTSNNTLDVKYEYDYLEILDTICQMYDLNNRERTLHDNLTASWNDVISKHVNWITHGSSPEYIFNEIHNIERMVFLTLILYVFEDRLEYPENEGQGYEVTDSFVDSVYNVVLYAIDDVCVVDRTYLRNVCKHAMEKWLDKSDIAATDNWNQVFYEYEEFIEKFCP